MTEHTDEKAEPIHTFDCESWGCAHCTVCGVGVLYGSRCHDHPATDPRWDGVVPPLASPACWFCSHVHTEPNICRARAIDGGPCVCIQDPSSPPEGTTE